MAEGDPFNLEQLKIMVAQTATTHELRRQLSKVVSLASTGEVISPLHDMTILEKYGVATLLFINLTSELWIEVYIGDAHEMFAVQFRRHTIDEMVKHLQQNCGDWVVHRCNIMQLPTTKDKGQHWVKPLPKEPDAKDPYRKWKEE